MKGYLLDTQVFLWCLMDSPRLTPEARELIADPLNPVYVSAATSWEIAIKKSLGKLKAPDNIDGIVEEMGFLKLPIYLYHGDTLSTLPFHHRDPFDRMLIAQAIAEGLVLISSDRKFEMYDVELIKV